MIRIMLALVIFSTSLVSHARHWPWQDPPEREVEYCMGFLMRSLGDFPVEGLSRVQLWLSWNELMKEVPVGHDSQNPEYQAGRDFFNEKLAAGEIQAILDKADTSCAFNKS